MLQKLHDGEGEGITSFVPSQAKSDHEKERLMKNKEHCFGIKYIFPFPIFSFFFHFHLLALETFLADGMNIDLSQNDDVSCKFKSHYVLFFLH